MTATAITPAGRLVALVKAAMPADIRVAGYDICGEHVSIQLWAGYYADSSERLRRIAGAFDLDFTETENEYGRLDLVARGVIDGVKVRFWDNVPKPGPARPGCYCECHKGATA